MGLASVSAYFLCFSSTLLHTSITSPLAPFFFFFDIRKLTLFRRKQKIRIDHKRAAGLMSEDTQTRAYSRFCLLLGMLSQPSDSSPFHSSGRVHIHIFTKPFLTFGAVCLCLALLFQSLLPLPGSQDLDLSCLCYVLN